MFVPAFTVRVRNIERITEEIFENPRYKKYRKVVTEAKVWPWLRFMIVGMVIDCGCGYGCGCGCGCDLWLWL